VDTPSTYSLDEETNVGGSLCIQPVTFLKSATLSQVTQKWCSSRADSRSRRKCSNYLTIVNAKRVNCKSNARGPGARSYEQRSLKPRPIAKCLGVVSVLAAQNTIENHSFNWSIHRMTALRQKRPIALLNA
jgi:hypothetical protein